MNKYQEALDRVKTTMSDGKSVYKSYTDSYSIFFKDIATLQELVDKATPKKPVRFKDKFYISPPKCPVCKTIPHTCTQKYCDECGQALDWEQEEV